MREILAALTTGQKIAVWAIIVPAVVAAVGGIIKYMLSKKKTCPPSTLRVHSDEQKIGDISKHATGVQAKKIGQLNITYPQPELALKEEVEQLKRRISKLEKARAGTEGTTDNVEETE